MVQGEIQTYRIVAIVALSVTISKLTKYDPVLFSVLFSIFLAYCFVSLAADLLLIIGISQNKPDLLLPYLSLNGIEIFALAISLIAGSAYFEELGSPAVLSYSLPVGIFLIAIDAACWFCLARLYKQIEEELEEKGEGCSWANIGCVFKLACGRSATMDIENELQT